MQIFAVAGVPLLVAGFFLGNRTALSVGLVLVVIDLVFVPREAYEDVWVGFLNAGVFQKRVVVLLVLLALLAPLAGALGPVAARGWILSKGVRADAVIERKIFSWWLPHWEFEVSYPTAAGASIRGKTYWIPEEVCEISPVETQVPVHYLPRNPRWFALDGVAPDNPSYYLPLACSLFAFLLWFSFRFLSRF